VVLFGYDSARYAVRARTTARSWLPFGLIRPAANAGQAEDRVTQRGWTRALC